MKNGQTNEQMNKLNKCLSSQTDEMLKTIIKNASTKIHEMKHYVNCGEQNAVNKKASTKNSSAGVTVNILVDEDILDDVLPIVRKVI